MRALARSYGDISTFTLSPTLMRMKFLRILPEMWARTSWPFGNATRNIVPGKTCVTVPVNSIGSSLATVFTLFRKRIPVSGPSHLLAAKVAHDLFGLQGVLVRAKRGVGRGNAQGIGQVFWIKFKHQAMQAGS